MISCFPIYLFTSQPFVFINSISVPKFNPIIFVFVYISFVTEFAVYVDVFLLSVFIIFTTESAVNSPDDFSSIVIILFDKFTSLNVIFLSLFSVIVYSFPSSVINFTLSVYMHNNLFLSW